MGRFSTTVHIKNDVDRMRFVNTFSDVMKKRGFAPCSEDEAAVSYCLAFGEGWVTLANEDYKNDPKKSSDDVREMSKALKTSAFSVEVVDSDFAIMTLCAPNGTEDRVVVGDGSGYDVPEMAGDRKLWASLLADGKTWEQFSEAAAAREVFVEDALGKVSAVLGIDPYYMDADHDEISAKADGNNNITAFYFKKAKEKSMTLRAAFFKVFGEALEPLGYKKIKSKYPYLVRVVNDEIIHYVSVSHETAAGRIWGNIKEKCFNVFCGASTIYNDRIDFECDPASFHVGFIDSISKVYTKSHWSDVDMKYRASIMSFFYNPTSTESLIGALQKALRSMEESAMPVINQAVTLRKCMDYFALMDHWINRPALDSSGEDLLFTKLFSADEYVMFWNEQYKRQEKAHIIDLRKSNSSPNIEEVIEKMIKDNVDGREKAKERNYELFTDPKLQEKAPAELERRKKENIEKLRGYGLDI